jgi:histidinol-phosphate/aromatic aminotransferase/cobyric acid decarboxylase-like protein
MPNHLRVTIGNKIENQTLIDAIKSLF